MTSFLKDHLLLLPALGVDRDVRILGGLLVLLDAWMWFSGSGCITVDLFLDGDLLGL